MILQMQLVAWTSLVRVLQGRGTELVRAWPRSDSARFVVHFCRWEAWRSKAQNCMYATLVFSLVEVFHSGQHPRLHLTPNKASELGYTWVNANEVVPEMQVQARTAHGLRAKRQGFLRSAMFSTQGRAACSRREPGSVQGRISSFLRSLSKQFATADVEFRLSLRPVRLT